MFLIGTEDYHLNQPIIILSGVSGLGLVGPEFVLFLIYYPGDGIKSVLSDRRDKICILS